MRGGYSLLGRTAAVALLAGVSPLALGGPAMAQQAGAQQEVLDEIIVTGVRASQQRSVDMKRSETSIVDAISAEDIGKLPDVTIADALQRVPGIQIRREAGEGSTVNVRGLPQVITMLNGEQYLSAGNLGEAKPNLSDVPAQLMNAVVVYKSTDTRNALSGISGTIDLRTRRPSDMPEGISLTGALEGQRGTDTKGKDYLANGLVSWRGDRIGALVSAAGSKANLGNNYSGVAGGLSGNNDWGGKAPTDFISPHGFESFHREAERKRLAVSGAFEADLGEGFTFIAEAFYTKMDEYNRSAGLNISNRWSGDAYGIWTKPTVSTPVGVGKWVAVNEYDIDAWWVNSFSVNRVNTSESKNFNAELNYDNGGPFKFEFRAMRADADRLSMNGQAQGDLSNWRYADGRFNLFRDANDRTRGTFYPKEIADRFPASRYTNNIVGSLGGRYVDPNPLGYGQNPQLHYNISGGHPVWTGFDKQISGGLGAGKTLTDYMANKDSYAIGAFSSEGNNEATSDLSVYRADGHYDFEEPFLGFLNKVDVGIRRSDRSVSIEQFHLFSNFYKGQGVNMAGQPNTSGCSAQWKAIDVVMNQNQCQAGEFVPDPVTGKPVFQGYTVNAPTRLDTYNNVIWVKDLGSITSGIPGFWAIDPRDFDDPEAFHKKVFGGADRVIVPGQSYDVDMWEDSGYVNTHFAYGPLSGTAGLKIIRTELQVRQNITGETKNYGDTNNDVGDVTSRRSYYDYLPAVNAAYDVDDNLRLRFSYSKTMQPLDLLRYGGALKINTADDPKLGIRVVTSAESAGNPELDPWRSDNWDAAVEYYIGRASMLNLSAFRLNIDSYVVTRTTNDGRYPDQDGVIRNTVPVTRPQQGEGGKVEGIEVGAKLSFKDFLDEGSFFSNFGLDTNYTYSPSEQTLSKKTPDGKDITAPFDDNSKHQVNVVAWYQDDNLQARIAYNYRSKRLQNVFDGQFPVYQQASQYVDMNVSYAINENITVYANGSNVLGEREDYVVEFAKGITQYAWQNEYEPRYTLGVRFKW
ncbi:MULTISPECIES: TonB-dependent receptor [unclassified Azospirillum]|uniref:TonB-dependent receptor n=1 Tax=unclassified Azospirillum TaxID=2630922 RepID=UPI000B73AFBD|nr:MULTISPECIES: TonB-dependent receptor [unclassified Azospirillum]SNR89590.1 TonB-dependent receptor [Azospirillum sp. RU38E]SNS05708.1 TonB-dependent receptor [Azospirillum sp. RU37A]